MSSVILLLGDQLFADLSALPEHLPIVMQEDVGLATRFRHHQQKIALFFSAMRHRAEELRQAGREVHYFNYDTGQPGLLDRLRSQNPDQVHTFRPHDRFFAAELEAAFGDRLRLADSPMFLTPDAFWRDYARGKRRLMGDFYRRQRARMGVLLEADGQPVGGRWSFDEENRQKLPKGEQPPPIAWERPDAITLEVIALVEREFSDHPGRARDFCWPVTHDAAVRWLDLFLEERLDQFGPYEDAVSRHHSTVYHSLLTPMLNCGLITPNQVVKRALEVAGERIVPLQSLEGFLRQIMGWREFIKKMDEEYAQTQLDQKNFFGHERRLAECWWTGETGLPPVDTAIRRCLDRGWCHHIERLMVVGAVMLMVEAHPDEAYRWFMEMFVDSAEWVMAPNVFGMSQFSDGGSFATKPYFSGSAYIRKMSDYPSGEWCDIWDGLYWRFIERHREFFMSNQRLATVARGVDRLEPQRKARIFAAAEAFIARVTEERGS